MLYVTRTSANGGGRKGRAAAAAAKRNEQAVLKEIRALAERYEVDLRMKTRANVAPDEAILR